MPKRRPRIPAPSMAQGLLALDELGGPAADTRPSEPLREQPVIRERAATRRSGVGEKEVRILPDDPDSSHPLSNEEVRQGFGAGIKELVDLRGWQDRADPDRVFQAVGEMAARAVELERRHQAPLRRLMEQEFSNRPDAPRWAGTHQATAEQLVDVARGYLYSGQTEAVAGDLVLHETLPLSIGQMGVCAVSYQGRHDQWHQRLVRRDLPIHTGDPEQELMALLDRRDRIARPGQANRMRQLSDLARRGLVGYMERYVMHTQCPGKWRIGNGVPTPLDLLTGMGNMDLLEMSLSLMRDMLLGDSRWIWVSSKTDEHALETVARALRPLEFAIFMRLDGRLRDQVGIGHYPPFHARLAEAFVEEVGPHLVIGAYRAGAFSPPRFFVAHEERSCEAALIAMADAAALQPQGVPALVQIARSHCRAALGADGSFEKMVEQAFRHAGADDWQWRF